MAFLSKIVVAATAFAALTAARPLAIRDVTSVVTETAYTTVDVPVTLWVDEDGKPLSTVAQGGNFAASATPAAEQSKVEISASPSTPQSVSVVPTTTPSPPAQVVPTTTSAPSVQTHAQAQAPAYTAPAMSSPEPVVTSPIASSPSASSPTTTAVAAPTNSASSGQSSVCTSGAPCSGDITHWDGGLGACGWNVDSNSEMQIAMPVGMMGSLSNSNPYCGMSVTVKNPSTGTTVQATVGDKCMGCTGESIDLTNALFNAVGNGCDGRCSGFEWWFN